MENKAPKVIDAFRCRATRRAIFSSSLDSYKLITIDNQPEELFDVNTDPPELCNLISEQPQIAVALERLLKGEIAKAEARRPTSLPPSSFSLNNDKNLADRLRGLGYIE